MKYVTTFLWWLPIGLICGALWLVGDLFETIGRLFKFPGKRWARIVK